MENQISLSDLFEGFPKEVTYLEDKYCTSATPVTYGKTGVPVYGKNLPIIPQYPGRTDSDHFKNIYLEELLPLEEYDKIIVLFSGGKDSMACYLRLLELGVPKEKIELWHHDIDGGHPERRMDWKCTGSYVKAFADAEGVPLLVSFRENGFFGELYRIGASEQVKWIDPETGEILSCKPSKKYLECQEIKKQCLDEAEDLLKEYGYRYKFPAKAASLSQRWCSAYLKIMVADSVITNLDRLEELGGKRQKFPAKGSTHQGRWCSGSLKASVQDSVTANLESTRSDVKVLICSGERRGESGARAKYNEMELHRTCATAKNHRLVHQWRPVIDWSQKDVWEIIKRHHINPHPCYRIGWPRCSCSACIFSTPPLMAGLKEVYPEEFEKLCEDEQILNFTIDSRMNLPEYIKGAKSCFNPADKAAVKAILTGEYPVGEIYVNDWKYPCGAFHGAEGGSC